MSVDDSYTVSLLHGDGADASTTITDGSGKVWTARNHAQIDTAQYVFGGASILFDGTDDYADTPDHADWDVFVGSGTVEFRIRFAALPGAGTTMQFLTQVQDGTHYQSFYVRNTGGVYTLEYQRYDSSLILQVAKTATLAINTWYHFAFCKNGNDYLFFVNGTQIGTTTTDATAITGVAGPVYLGAWGGSAAFMNGWIDEFRVSNVARWTSSPFTLPTTSYGPSDSIADTVTLTDTIDGQNYTGKISDTVTLTDTIDGYSLTGIATDSVSILDDIRADNLIRTKRRHPNTEGHHISLLYQSVGDDDFALYYQRLKLRRTVELYGSLRPSTQGKHIGLSIQSVGDDPLTLEYVTMELRRVNA